MHLIGDMHKFRIAFVDTHPIQHFAPLYAHLNRTGEFMVTALYLSDFSVRGYCPGKLAAWTRRPLFAAASESFAESPRKSN